MSYLKSQKDQRRLLPSGNGSDETASVNQPLPDLHSVRKGMLKIYKGHKVVNHLDRCEKKDLLSTLDEALKGLGLGEGEEAWQQD